MLEIPLGQVYRILEIMKDKEPVEICQVITYSLAEVHGIEGNEMEMKPEAEAEVNASQSSTNL